MLNEIKRGWFDDVCRDVLEPSNNRNRNYTDYRLNPNDPTMHRKQLEIFEFP